ncbi:hypothetical protein GCM10022393_40310 [Aquimarina addita]|uniref:Secretion system C-terminal sorting domain-containing protein n=1 Tax=Aquimarina addita TaxID=870485 RepID=A0ABP6UTB1_9FLAO
MKKLINLSLLVFTLLSLNTVNAAGKVSVEITNVSVINVSLTEIAKGEKLFLKDFNGMVLFKTTLNASPIYQKNFNLNKVSNGIYFVETESDYEIKVTPVLKNESGVSLITDSEVTIFKPQIEIVDNKVSVMFLNTRKSPMDLNIYDENGVKLVEELEIQEKVVERVYDFSNVEKNTYYMYFVLEDRTISEQVIIK